MEGIKYPADRLDKDDSIFACICPETSGTRQKQSIQMKVKGVTVAAYIEKHRNTFYQYISEIKKAESGFNQSPLLHLTLLTLFQEEEKMRANPLYTQQAIDSLERFFTNKEIKSFDVKFNLIRPGSWNIEDKQRYLLGDGTVVAMGNLGDENTRKFAKIGKDLAYHLRYELPNIVGCDFKRKFDTVWCTLGYYDREDFEITDEVNRTFEGLRNINISTRIDRFDIVEFRKKSLTDGKRLATIELS
jgi:hypothetical protein